MNTAGRDSDVSIEPCTERGHDCRPCRCDEKQIVPADRLLFKRLPKRAQCYVRFIESLERGAAVRFIGSYLGKHGLGIERGDNIAFGLSGMKTRGSSPNAAAAERKPNSWLK